jgi:hypothetical protein
MSLISTVRCGNQWVRYFVVDTEPYYGEAPKDWDASPDWDNMDTLIDSFPGKISDEEVYVPPTVVRFLQKLLVNPETLPTDEALRLTQGCPIDLHRLANYLSASVDISGGYGTDVTATGGVGVTLFKAYYSVSPSLKELSALKTQELGLTTEEINRMLGPSQSKTIKASTGVTVGKHVKPKQQQQMS